MKAVSYSSFASPGLQPAELETLIAQSLANNARDGVTGVLMFNGAAFVQLVEGPEDAIDRLVQRIATDERNCQMEVRDERRLNARIFPDWTVGYVKIEGGWLEGQYDVADALARPMPRTIRSLLMSMAETLPFD